MTRELLRRLDASRVFQSVLPPDALSALHVPFDELTGEERCEARLQLLGGAPAQVLLVGPSGSGKSSAVAWSANPEAGIFGIIVPVQAYATATISASDLAGLVIGALRRSVGGDSIDLGLADPSRSRWRRSVGVDLKVVSLGLEEQLPTSLGDDLAQRADAIQQAFEVIRLHGLAPVLILDDTDKWVSLRGEPQPIVEEFFSGPVRWLIELGVGVIVHVQDRHVPFLGAAGEWFSEHVLVPELTSSQARQVLLARIDAVAPDEPSPFTDEAMDRLLHSVAEDGSSIRTAIVLAGMAVKEAVLADRDVVDTPAVDAAIQDRQ